MTQFVAVVRNKSITKAAEELFVAQPAISATIKKMESELGMNLLHYENKQLYLTPEGEQVYKIITEILSAYLQLENFSDTKKTIKDQASTGKKSFAYYAAPSIHDYVTPRLQLFDLFPNMLFSTYNCNNLDNFFALSQNQENVFGIFFIPDPILRSLPVIFPGFSFETITTLPAMLLTSYKNTSPIAKKKEISLKELEDLPLIRCLGSDFAINESLSECHLSYCIETSSAKYVDTILDKRPNFFVIGTNIFSLSKKQNSISIPISDAPLINLIFISKQQEENQDIFSRLLQTLRSIYTH